MSIKPELTTCQYCGNDFITINKDEDFYCGDCRYGATGVCEMCSGELIPRVLVERGTQNRRLVQVCADCGLVKR
jgi:ribosomal protein S27AE